MPTTQPAPGKKFVTVPRVINGVPSGEETVEVDASDAPSWGPNDSHRILNKYIQRSDGPAKATGTAIYTYDVKLPGMLYARFVTSPFAHARVRQVDVNRAAAIAGVKAVVPFGNIEVKFEGAPVVAVAAISPEIADDAVHAVQIDWEPLPFVVKADDALSPDAPPVFRQPGFRRKHGDEERVNALLATADVVVDQEYRTAILHHCCLETHGVVADYRGGDSATVYASTQGTFTIPGDAARELKLDESAVTGIVQYMGGGFGSKFGIGIAGQWACRLSKLLNTPVKLMLPRTDEFLMAGNGPGSVQRLKAGASRDGTLLAMHAVQYVLGGVGGSNLGQMPYQYTAKHSFSEQGPLYTNEDSSVALRAPGFPQASFAMESLMDELANKLGMDPIEFRKKNLFEPDETGKVVNLTAWHRQLDRGAKEIGWENRNQTPGSGAGPLRRGIGCGIGAWGGGGQAKCVVEVTIGRDGSVIAACGTQDLGTGTRTYFRAIVAEELGLQYADVHEKIGSTQLGDANASGGSTTAASLAPATKDAARNARMEMARKVAPLLGAEPDAVAFVDGMVAGNGKSLDWKQACAALPAAGLRVQGVWKPGLSGHGAHGASFAEVEVDTETGHVRVIKMCHVQDGGLILNRLATESQINGGMIQGIGMALYEGRVMDSRLGVMVNSGFGDYKIPGALEIPEMVPIIDDGDPREAVIGIAEPANIPGVGAVANAVFNACGVRVRELPITPDKILNGLARLA